MRQPSASNFPVESAVANAFSGRQPHGLPGHKTFRNACPRLRLPIALDALGAAVPACDMAVRVQHIDGAIEDAVHQQPEGPLAFKQPSLGRSVVDFVHPSPGKQYQPNIKRSCGFVPEVYRGATKSDPAFQGFQAGFCRSGSDFGAFAASPLKNSPGAGTTGPCSISVSAEKPSARTLTTRRPWSSACSLEQALKHWRSYAVALVFMAVSAGATALSAYRARRRHQPGLRQPQHARRSPGSAR